MRRFLIAAVVLLAAVLMVNHAEAQQQPIKIGVLFVSSGPMGGYGKHGNQSVQMALEEINAQGASSAEGLRQYSETPS